MENEDEIRKAASILGKLAVAKRRKNPDYGKKQSENVKKRWKKVMEERRRKSGLSPTV